MSDLTHSDRENEAKPAAVLDFIQEADPEANPFGLTKIRARFTRFFHANGGHAQRAAAAAGYAGPKSTQSVKASEALRCPKVQRFLKHLRTNEDSRLPPVASLDEVRRRMTVRATHSKQNSVKMRALKTLRKIPDAREQKTTTEELLALGFRCHGDQLKEMPIYNKLLKRLEDEKHAEERLKTLDGDDDG